MGDFEEHLEARVARCLVEPAHSLMAKEIVGVLEQRTGALLQCLEVQKKLMEMVMAVEAGAPMAEIDSLVSTPVLEMLYPWTASTPCPEVTRLLLQSLGSLPRPGQEPLVMLTTVVVEPVVFLQLVSVDALAG